MSQIIRMPFEGIESFLGVPILQRNKKIDEFQVAFLGIPYDMGTTNRPGTRFGPRAVRSASQMYAYFKMSELATMNPDKAYEGLWDIDNKKALLTGLRICNTGDVCIIPADLHKSFKNIIKGAYSIISKGIFPVFVGGDHSITYLLLQAYKDFSDIHLIHFDTHMDTWENIDGFQLEHGGPLFLVQKLKNIKTITHIGLHGFLNDEEMYQAAIDKGHSIITANDIHKKKPIDLEKILPKNDMYYLTIDIDVCDPAYAPGTGTPEFGGLTSVQLFDWLDAVCSGRKIVGIDLVEVNPLFDPAQITSILATQIIIKVLSGRFPS